jgi:hypothetical protein
LEGNPSASRGMERVAPVLREMERDWRVETVHDSISIAEVEAGAGCWDGGGTEL